MPFGVNLIRSQVLCQAAQVQEIAHSLLWYLCSAHDFVCTGDEFVFRDDGSSYIQLSAGTCICICHMTHAVT